MNRATFQVKSVKEVITRGMRQFQHTFHPSKRFLSQIREKFIPFRYEDIFFARQQGFFLTAFSLQLSTNLWNLQRIVSNQYY